MENELIAYCGLDCMSCEARIATLRNDDELRRVVSRRWGEMNHTDQITPDTINCMGCRTDGVKFVYCSSMCPVRKCASAKGYSTCAECPDKTSCEKITPFSDNAVVRANLGL